MERIKFYSINDMVSGENLIRIKAIVDNFDENKKDYNINDIIELYNITKYVDTECYKKYKLNWSEDDISKIKDVIKKYKGIIARYIKSISNENITTKYMEIKDDYYDYREDFFELLEKYKVYENISECIFSELLHTPKVFLEYILRNKNMTYYHGNAIRERFYEDNLLVEDGIIDQELLEVSSTSILFESVKSLIDTKYIYGNDKSQEFNNIRYYFFSAQCLLHYTEKYRNKRYTSFYELLLKENVKANDYSRYSERLLNYVIDNGYVFIDSDDYIRVKDKRMITILNDLYNNEVINYWKYPLKYREKMDELIEKNMLLKGSTLFSKQEQDYFNFYLNQRSFNNTYDLRNKYLHGNKLKDDDENTHYNNYMLFLKLIILIIIKINDELCAKEEIKKNKNIKEKE